MSAARSPFDEERLRAIFLRLLTHDSDTLDRRSRDFNQAIFDAKSGWSVFNETDLGMVMDKFDRAVRAYAADTEVNR